ncbi:MAG: hypothetical protein KJ057_09045 [Phycisphaerae bacterium]|nr:MAG: hypothetical protein EDS66_14370 [Planctomycetota bacterium]MBE7456092.1 hypothetical protein [Planctomycetia bacterium]MCL4718604.1 hypothetical protein [Phycisphaerae bacterium]MCQ3921270.1 hypothetical protein [Planctomycetota bacterium]
MNFRENLSRSREVLAGYWRQGMHELGSIFYGPGTVAQHPELGMIATRPPGLVTEGLRPDKEHSQGKDDATPSILEERLKQAERQVEAEREPESPQQERD